MKITAGNIIILDTCDKCSSINLSITKKPQIVSPVKLAYKNRWNTFTVKCNDCRHEKIVMHEKSDYINRWERINGKLELKEQFEWKLKPAIP